MKTGFLCNAPALKERRNELRKSQTEVEKALWASSETGNYPASSSSVSTA